QVDGRQSNAGFVPVFVAAHIFHQAPQFNQIRVVHTRLAVGNILFQLAQALFQLIQIALVIFVLALGFFQLFFGVFQALVGFDDFHRLVLYHQAHFGVAGDGFAFAAGSVGCFDDIDFLCGRQINVAAVVGVGIRCQMGADDV